MTLLPILVLALVQGITEFLPISSSGHLLLAHAALGDTGQGENAWQDHMLLDVAVHIGTLFSVLLYFRKDILTMLFGLKDIAKGDVQAKGSRMIFLLAMASVPVIAGGFALHIMQPDWLLSVKIVAWTTLVFGVLLWIADNRPVTKATMETMSYKDAIIIGLMQTLALIPGTSRAGITMTAGRFLGYNRIESARFSLLLGVIAIGGAGALSIKELIEADNIQIGLNFALLVSLSFATGLAAIAIMMKWLERMTFKPFAIYRVILGIAMLIGLYGGFVTL